MKSPNTSIHGNAGFTLLEIIVVIGMMSIIVGAGMAVTFDSYRGYLFRSEYSNVAHILATARNRSANNFNESQHGVKFFPDKYILFVGSDYNSSDPNTHESFPTQGTFTITSSDGNPMDEVTFKQLSGDLATCEDSSGPVSGACRFTFAGDYTQTKTLEINDVGGIIW